MSPSTSANRALPPRLSGQFAAVAKHYGASVAVCPPWQGNRKGVVEKANHAAERVARAGAIF
jgi:transposase